MNLETQNYICILQARVESTRLPNKALKMLDNDYSLIEYSISQLKNSKLLNGIILATTKMTSDDDLIEIAKREKIPFFRGESEDVLKRFYDCATYFSVSTIVRITGDNPLIDPTFVDDAIKIFNSNNFDFVSNCLERTFPYGTEVEIFSFSALKRAMKLAKKKSEREHVTPFFFNNPEKFKIFNIRNSQNLSHLRWTVDHENDFKLVQKIINKILKRPILTSDIVNLFNKEPELFLINKGNIPDEGYFLSLQNDKIN